MRPLPDPAPPNPLRGTSASRLQLLLLAAACVVLGALVYLLAVFTTRGQDVDNSAFGNLTSDVSVRVFDATDDLLSTISIASVALLGLAIAGIAIARGRSDLAVAALLLVGAANVTTQILKIILPRPDLETVPVNLAGGSFPSGHVTVAMSLAMALTFVTPNPVRPLAAVVGTLYAAGVGVGVLALNWHRPSDVIGAYLVATTWAALAAMLIRPERADRARSALDERLVALAAGALVLAFMAVAATAALRRVDVITIVDDRTAFVAASIVVVITAFGVMAVLLRTLRDTIGRGLAPG